MLLKLALPLLMVLPAIAPAQVRVERHRVLFYSHEYLRHSQYLQRKGNDVIAFWGWRIFESPLDVAKYKEVFPEDPKYRFSNGSVAMDVNGDGDEELIVGRYVRENWKTHDIHWYEPVPGQAKWQAHLMASLPGEKKEMPHDMAVFRAGSLQGIVLTIGREDLYLLVRPQDPRQPWTQHYLVHLPSPPQSGMRIADINGDGRPDIITGMLWLECPPDPANGDWKVHRFGDWDQTHKPWGGMIKHAVADFDGDGQLEIAVNEAEIADSRLAIFKRDPKNPEALWKSTAIDVGLYCPHSMETADLDGDGKPDLIVGEMDAGGWEFPLTTKPRIYAYLNQGNSRFRRVVLSEGLGLHEAQIAPKPFEGRILFYGINTTQPWFDGMMSHLSTWTLASDFKDTFARAPGAGWTWMREQPGAWRAEGGRLRIQTLPGTLWGKENTARNILLRQTAAPEPFATEADVSSEVQLDGEQAGMIWYRDDDNYIKLVQEAKDKRYVILAREEHQSAGTFGKLPLPAAAVTLRLEWKDGRVQGLVREQGKQEWQVVGDCPPLPFREFQVGVFTHIAPGKSDRWAEFRGFRIDGADGALPHASVP